MTVWMYSLPTQQCRACWATEKRLTSKGVEFHKIMLNETPEAMDVVKELGYASAPVVVIEEDGEIVDHWSGFSDSKIEGLANKAVA